MTENRRAQPELASRLAVPRNLRTLVTASLRNGSGLSLVLSDATLGVSVDQLGDWTIAVGLSSTSNRFHPMVSALAGLGFFEAAEKDGATYLLWTSLLSESEAKLATEQTLSKVLRAFGEPAFSNYIS